MARARCCVPARRCPRFGASSVVPSVLLRAAPVRARLRLRAVHRNDRPLIEVLRDAVERDVAFASGRCSTTRICDSLLARGGFRSCHRLLAALGGLSSCASPGAGTSTASTGASSASGVAARDLHSSSYKAAQTTMRERLSSRVQTRQRPVLACDGEQPRHGAGRILLADVGFDEMPQPC